MPARSTLWILAIGASLLAGEVQAGSVTLVDQSYTVGAPGAVSVNALQIASPTTLNVTLSSIPWPQALASISFERCRRAVSAGRNARVARRCAAAARHDGPTRAQSGAGTALTDEGHTTAIKV